MDLVASRHYPPRGAAQKGIIMQKIRQVVVALLTLGLVLGPGASALLWAAEGQVNINTAGTKELEALPMVGATKAQAIVRYRKQHGQFRSVDDLLKVKDIGDSTLQAIKPHLTLSGASTLGAKTTASKAAPLIEVQVRPTITTQTGDIRLLTDQDYYPALQTLINQAQVSIDLAMFLFKTTDAAKNRAASLAQDLIAARKRGITVNLLLERSDYDPKLNRENERVAARLKKEGVRVRFDSAKTTTHTKIVVVDQRYSLVGSHNFTGSALSRNHEASLLVDNQELAAALLKYMAGIE